MPNRWGTIDRLVAGVDAIPAPPPRRCGVDLLF